MAKLKGNISALVKGAAATDKREQLIPETKPQPKPARQHTKP